VREPVGAVGDLADHEAILPGAAALAGMFYAAVPKFSYAFIARMTIHYHYTTIFPNLLATRMPHSARAEQQLRIRARGA
jgi:hypothetical protein